MIVCGIRVIHRGDQRLIAAVHPAAILLEHPANGMLIEQAAQLGIHHWASLRLRAPVGHTRTASRARDSSSASSVLLVITTTPSITSRSLGAANRHISLPSQRDGSAWSLMKPVPSRASASAEPDVRVGHPSGR